MNIASMLNEWREGGREGREEGGRRVGGMHNNKIHTHPKYVNIASMLNEWGLGGGGGRGEGGREGGRKEGRRNAQ